MVLNWVTIRFQLRILLLGVRVYMTSILNKMHRWIVAGGFQCCNKIWTASRQGRLGAGGQLALHMAAVDSTGYGNQLFVAVPATTLFKWPVPKLGMLPPWYCSVLSWLSYFWTNDAWSYSTWGLWQTVTFPGWFYVCQYLVNILVNNFFNMKTQCKVAPVLGYIHIWEWQNEDS